MCELFYVFDLGEGLAAPFSKIFSPLLARIVAQSVSWSVNAALWAGFTVGVAKLVSLAI